MTLCAQYTDNMKKRTLAQNGTSPEEDCQDRQIGGLDDFGLHLSLILQAQDARNEFIKPKRPRGKKVFSTDKMVKR